MKKATDAYNSLRKIVKDLNLLLNTPNITVKKPCVRIISNALEKLVPDLQPAFSRCASLQKDLESKKPTTPRSRTPQKLDGKTTENKSTLILEAISKLNEDMCRHFKSGSESQTAQTDTIKDHITTLNKTTATKIDNLPTSSMNMDQVKTTFADVLKTTTPDYSKQQEEIVRATSQRIDINFADREKRASNIVIN